MNEDNHLLHSVRDIRLKNCLDIKEDDISAWNESIDEHVFTINRNSPVLTNTIKIEDNHSKSRNISPLRFAKKKFHLNSNLAPLTYSNNPKSITLQKIPTIARYWQKRYTMAKTRNQINLLKYKNEFHSFANYRLSPTTMQLKEKTIKLNSPILSFLPQIDVFKMKIAKWL